MWKTERNIKLYEHLDLIFFDATKYNNYLTVLKIKEHVLKYFLSERNAL